MSNTEPGLSELFGEQCIKSFGKCLRYAIWRDEDYGSLIELENAETPSQFLEAVRKFLRRYRSGAFQSEDLRDQAARLRQAGRWDDYKSFSRQHELGPRPTEGELERLMQLANDERWVRRVKSAILSYGLVKRDPFQELNETGKEI